MIFHKTPLRRLVLFLALFAPPVAYPLRAHTSPVQADTSLVTHTMGVGGVTPTAARIRIKISREGMINAELSVSPAFTATLSGTPVRATSEGNHAVLIDVSGLQPDTKYYYRATVDGTPQPQVQSFSTFPPEGIPAVFSFAFGSCQQSFPFVPGPEKPGRVFTPVARSGARFFLQLGDWGYPDSVDNFPYNNAFFASDYRLVQEAYLFRYDPNRNMDTVLRTMPVDYVYDDHDFMNGNSSATSSSLFLGYRPNPGGSDFVVAEVLSPPGARENTIRGYKENMPTYPLVNGSRGIYHSFRFGTAEFFMLDLRAQRSPNLEIFRKNLVTGRWEVRIPPKHSILGREDAPGTGETQLEWLLNGLRNSTADWKFLVSSVPFNRSQGLAIALGMLLQDSVLLNTPEVPPGSTGIWAAFEFSDKWVGFPADLDTVLRTIQREGIRNVIVLSGDSHTAAIDDGANAGLPEIMAGGLEVTNSRMAALFAQFGLSIWNRGGQGLSTQLFNNAFGRVTVFGRDSVLLQLVDEEGTLFASHTVKGTPATLVPGPNAPEAFSLLQNYPNPFNGTTTIGYRITRTGPVYLGVFDLLGREVATLLNETKPPGVYLTQFDASAIASGVYVYTLRAHGQQTTRRLMIIR